MTGSSHPRNISVLSLDQFVDLPDEIVIAFYMGAAGRRDLDEDEPFFILRILLQEPVDRQEPFDDPFRVIDSLHAYRHDLAVQFHSSRIFSFCFRTLSVGVPKTLRSTLMGKARDEGLPAAPYDAEFSVSTRDSIRRLAVSRKLLQWFWT